MVEVCTEFLFAGIDDMACHSHTSASPKHRLNKLVQLSAFARAEASLSLSFHQYGFPHVFSKDRFAGVNISIYFQRSDQHSRSAKVLSALGAREWLFSSIWQGLVTN